MQTVGNSVADRGVYLGSTVTSSYPSLEAKVDFNSESHTETKGDSILVNISYNPATRKYGHMVLRKAEDVGRPYDSSLLRDLGNNHPAIQGIEQTIKSLETVKTIDEAFIASGKFARIEEYARSHGLGSFQREKAYGAGNSDNLGIMFTFPTTKKYTVIGANADLRGSINEDKDDYGVTANELLEYVITHEYFHNLQPRRILKEHDLLAEAHNDLQISKYFFSLAQDGIDVERNNKLSKLGYNRFVRMLRNYVRLFEVSIGDKEFKELIEGNDYKTIVEVLKSRAKIKSNRIAAYHTLEEEVCDEEEPEEAHQTGVHGKTDNHTDDHKNGGIEEKHGVLDDEDGHSSEEEEAEEVGCNCECSCEE